MFKNKKRAAVFVVVITIVLFVGNWFYCNNPFNPYYKVKNLRNLPEGTPVYIGDNKLFFSGIYSEYERFGRKKEKITCASVYDIKKQKNIPLNTCMNVPRNNYIPILLDSNRVLILRGNGKGKLKYETGNVAEIYDIKENKFRRIENSKIACNSFTKMEKINKNNFLLVHAGNGQIFNSTLETFNLIGQTKCYFLQDNIKICNNIPLHGVEIIKLSDESILFVGQKRKSNTENAMIYNCKENRFLPTGSQIYPQSARTLIKLSNNNILIVGGNDIFQTRENNSYITGQKKTEIYNIKKKEFSEFATLNRGRSNPIVLNINDKIFVFGGQEGETFNTSYPKEVEMCHIAEKKWEKIGRIKRGFSYGNAIKINSKEYIIGKNYIKFK